MSDLHQKIKYDKVLIGRKEKEMALRTQEQVIKIDLFDTSGVTITEFVSRDKEKVYQLRWTDYVANEWTEHYRTLAEALARVAVLAYCLQDEDSLLGFKTSYDEGFSRFANKFLESETH